MKLFYSAGSCSTSCHITLEESGLPYQAVSVDWDNTTDPNIALVNRLNPLGTLPVMTIEHNRVLSQNVAIHTYVADQVPDKKLLPRPGSVERAEAMNCLSFIAADLHKSFSPLFGLKMISKDKEVQTQIDAWARKDITFYLDYLNKHLSDREYMVGSGFSVADAYCFVVVGWTKFLNISTSEFSHLNAYLSRIYQRPSVQTVYKAEGLLE